MSTSSNLSGQLANVKSIRTDTRFGATPAWWSQVCRSRAAFYILTILASFDNPKRGCFPSIIRIALAAHCTERSVYRHLSYLENLGLISRRRGKNIVFFEIVYDRSQVTVLSPPSDSFVTAK